MTHMNSTNHPKACIRAFREESQTRGKDLENWKNNLVVGWEERKSSLSGKKKVSLSSLSSLPQSLCFPHQNSESLFFFISRLFYFSDPCCRLSLFGARSRGTNGTSSLQSPDRRMDRQPRGVRSEGGTRILSPQTRD